MSKPINKSVPYERQFARNPKSEFWHEENNGDITPKDVYINSNKKHWFVCDECHHPFDSQLNNIHNGKWCPYCAHIKLCDDTECKICFDKSFASHDRARCWHDERNGNVKPRDVARGSHKKIWFVCDECHHPFDSNLYNIHNGKWCPYCAHIKLCDDTECKICFDKSFASHDRARCWHDERNGNVKPRDVARWSNKKHWFLCDECHHSFRSVIGSIYAGSWCSHCRHKTEKKLYEALLPMYPDLIKEFKVDWCRNPKKKNETNYHFPFDFCIEELQTLIELDGRQHIVSVPYFDRKIPFQERHERDVYKEKCANENGYNMIRILQEDVLYDRNDWRSNLQREIEYIKENNTILHDRYICDNNEYDIFMD